MSETKKKRRVKKRWITVLIVVILIVGIHLALEPVALYYVNKELDKLEGYKGHVEDIDIRLWRGAYEIEGLDIKKEASGELDPFFSAALIDISVEWRALFKGSIVSEIIVVEPVINFEVEPSTGQVQSGGNNDWVETVNNLTPLSINRFEVINGSVHYKDRTQDPNVDVSAYNIEALATNLTNVNKSDELLPSTVTVSSKTSGDGDLNGEMKINPIKETPDFDLNVEVNDMNLTYLKDFTEAYANFNFKEGKMYISSEVAMKNGEFEGYLKPVLEGVKIIDLSNEETSFWRKIWEVVIGVTFEVFENQPNDRFATRVPFSGNTNTAEVQVIPTLANVLKNAFISSFSKDVDESVDIGDVGKEEEEKGFLKRIFDGDDDEEEEEKNPDES